MLTVPDKKYCEVRVYRAHLHFGILHGTLQTLTPVSQMFLKHGKKKKKTTIL